MFGAGLTIAGCSSDDSSSSDSDQAATATENAGGTDGSGGSPTSDETPGGETASGGGKPGEASAQPGQYVEYTPELVASTPGDKLLFFHASWCSQCQALEDDIEASGVPEGVTIFKVDYDSNQDLRQKYGVTLQTTMVKVDDDGEKIDSFVPYEDPTVNSVSAALLQ